MSSYLSVAQAEKIVLAPKIMIIRPDFSMSYSRVPIRMASSANVPIEGELWLKYIRGLNGISLVYRSKRIRGINYETGHTNDDGSYIEGWHEHVWREKIEDRYVIPVKEFTSKGRFQVHADDLLDLALQRWYITFKGPIALKMFK